MINPIDDKDAARSEAGSALDAARFDRFAAKARLDGLWSPGDHSTSERYQHEVGSAFRRADRGLSDRAREDAEAAVLAHLDQGLDLATAVAHVLDEEEKTFKENDSK